MYTLLLELLDLNNFSGVITINLTDTVVVTLFAQLLLQFYAWFF